MHLWKFEAYSYRGIWADTHSFMRIECGVRTPIPNVSEFVYLYKCLWHLHNCIQFSPYHITNWDCIYRNIYVKNDQRISKKYGWENLLYIRIK